MITHSFKIRYILYTLFHVIFILEMKSRHTRYTMDQFCSKALILSFIEMLINVIVECMLSLRAIVQDGVRVDILPVVKFI